MCSNYFTFICKDGEAVKNLVDAAIKTQERQNFKLKIIAKTPKISDDIVAEFPGWSMD